MYRLRTCLVVSFSLLALTGCVHVTTESGGVDQRRRVSDIRADQLRSDWAQVLHSSGNPELGVKLAEKIREATAIYQDLGHQIAYHWEDGNNGRGEPIRDDEMQQRVPGWIAGEEPILSAYDDIVDMTLQSFHKSEPFDAMTGEVLNELIGQFNQLYSVVAYPKGTVADYGFAVDALVSKIGLLATEFEREMARYR
jgi:hypothetical protein